MKAIVPIVRRLVALLITVFWIQSIAHTGTCHDEADAHADSTTADCVCICHAPAESAPQVIELPQPRLNSRIASAYCPSHGIAVLTDIFRPPLAAA